MEVRGEGVETEKMNNEMSDKCRKLREVTW